MASDILVKIGADITDFSRKMAESNKALSNFGKANAETFDAFKKTGAMITGVGTLIAGGLGIAVKTSANFEQAMSNVKAISGAVGKDFDSLRDKAIEMGAKTAFSASQSADAMANLAQMGWKTDEILAGIEHTLNLAAAGGLELADAAMIAANTINQFGLDAGEAERVADVFAKTAASAGTDVYEMAHAMQYAGANAAAAGLDIEQTAALIGILGDAGISGSKAGTALNAMLRDLKKNAEDGALAVGKQTISLYDANGAMRPLPDVIADVIRATEGMSDAQRDAALSNLFGEQAMVAFNSIASQGADSVNNLAKELYGAGGAAAEMADVQMDNLNGAITELSSAFEGVQIALGSALIPYIRKAAELLKGLADWFNGLSDGAKKSIAIITAIASALMLIAGPALLLIGFIPQIIAGFTAIIKVGAALIGAAKGIGAAIAALTGPIGWTVAGVGALTAGIIGAVKWFKRESKEAKKLNAETEKLAESTNDLTKATEASADAYKDKQSETMANLRHTDELAKKVEDLAKKENLSAVEKQMLASYTKELNESVDGLNLAYDDEAKALNMSSEELRARLDLYKEQETANLAMERAREISEEMIQTEQKLAEVNALREEWNQKLEDGSVKSREHKKAIKELDEQEQGLSDTLDELSSSYQEMESQVEKSLNAVAEAAEESKTRQVLTYEALSDEHKSLVDDMRTNWQAIADASTDMFEKINTKAKISFEEMEEIFEHNRKATANWAENLEKLADAGVSSAFLDTFRKKGPQSAAEVQALVDADIEEVKKLGKGFEEQTKKALEQMAQAYNLDKTQFNAVKKLVEDTGLTFEEAVKKANFEQYGENIVDGTAEGIDSNIGLAVTSVGHMSDSMAKEFMSLNKIQSPSKLYHGFGSDIVRGLLGGLDKEKSKPTSTIKKMSSSMTSEIRKTIGSYRTLGIDAISGLQRGLNAGRNSVLNTARNIANSVTSTIKSALRIQSPSRVLMEIGKWTSQGLADGIEDYAYLVDKASDMLAESAIPDVKNIDLSYATPDGVTARSLAGAVSGTVDVNNRDDRLINAIGALERRLTNLEVVMDGREVGRIVEPHVTENQERKNLTRERFV